MGGEFWDRGVDENIDAFRLHIDDLRVDGRIGGLVGSLDRDHRFLFAEPVLQALQIVLTKIVVLIEHPDLAVGLLLQEVGRVDAALALVIGLPADRPGVALRIVPFRRAGRDEKLRHLLLVHILPDRAVGRRAERADRAEHLVLLDELADLLDGFRRRIGVVIGEQIDLPPVHAALVVDHLAPGDDRFRHRRIGGGGTAIGAGIADLDLGVGDARAVFLLRASGDRGERQHGRRGGKDRTASHLFHDYLLGWPKVERAVGFGRHFPASHALARRTKPAAPDGITKMMINKMIP